MATKARQQYFADEVSLSKEKREFSIADEIQQKIDSIEEGAQVNKIETIKVNGTALVPDAYKAVDIDVPEVIDNLYTVDSDNALSAKQGKLLYDYIQNIASRGRFLSNWNSATGLPMTNPSESPYPYKSGDYFVVSNVAGLGGTNYRPDGSSYIIGQASTVVETEDVSVSDFYFYDGTNWLLLSNSGRQMAVDTSLSTTSTNPVENRVITNALNGKQETLIAGANIQIAADGKTISATDTTYVAGDFDIKDLADSTGLRTEWSGKQDELIAGSNIQIAADGKTISATDTTYSAGPGISISNNNVISNTQTSAEWGNITGTLSDQTDLQSALDAKQDILTAGDNVTIGEVCIDISDMQGPAPDGFHVPLNTEWQAVYNIWTALGGGSSDGTNFGIALKLPFAGRRNDSDSNAHNQGGYGRYWSSSRYSTNNAYHLYLESTVLGPQTRDSRSYGFSVRCFKDTPTIPTSSWTKLYGTSIEAGGIFWSSTDGLISLSSNGTTWITIMDKNLGATTVWNSGDTLSEANCGKYYQRGNNYGFPRTGSVTTSSTQVNASVYGPGNYYSSSTFIIRNSSPYRWDSTDNGNLWGGVTQGTRQDCDLTISATDTTYTAGDNIQISAQNVISATDTTYTAGTGINIDSNNVISNTQTSAEWGNITGTLSDQTDLQTALNAKQDNMVILKYGISTWNDFITAYNKNGVIYCRASSNSNPASGSQTRLAFMAYVNNETTPTEVEFQYYRSRSSHSTAANALDEVYVYKLVSTGGGTWSVTQRDIVAKPLAGTGIGLTYNASGMTISVDTSVLATKTYVDEHDTVVSAAAPSSPTEGMVWYDTTNDQLKVYDGTNWNVTGKEYNAGEGIEIKNGPDYSAMQGPAPSGFHVPLQSEWVALCEILTNTFGLDYNGITMKTYLKMPFAGGRNSSANVSDQGTYGYYWSSTPSNTYYAYRFGFDSSDIYTYYYYYRADGYSVRCFKDTPTIPTSSWTTLYDGSSVATGAGVFWNSTDGLISVSGDGVTWYTIMDKNLGATAVFNQGDTETDANCGYFYQWGNNYGFAHSGTVATSSTQVDATNYGPGNYYSSSTFITRSSSPYDWSSVQNDNLWGGVTGVVTLDNAITNTGVLSVNGNTGAVTVNEFKATNGGVKVFDFPAVNDDITDLVAWVSDGGGAILKEGGPSSNRHFRVTRVDLNTPFLTVECFAPSTNQTDAKNIFYNSSKIVTDIVDVSQNYFTPGGTATTGYVVTKTASGYEWQAPTEPTVISGDSGVTYTIKVSNSEPSGASSTTITLVP